MKEINESNLQTIIAEDIMNDNVELIRSDMTITQVAHMMMRLKISGYPVIDPQMQIIGIVTLSDFFILVDKLFHRKGIDLTEKIAQVKDLPVTEIMSSNVISISKGTTLGEIIDAMVKWRIHTFPVMENGKIIGIIDRHDVLNATFVYGSR